jgi:uncharacterized membrane protein HdeD (DUF308 family)
MASNAINPVASSADGRGRGWSIAIGILLILAGLAAIVIPPVAGLAATVVFGWLIMVAGIAHLVYAWSARGAGAVVWQVILGLLYLFVAFYLIVHPGRGLLTLTLVLGSYFIVEGILEIVMFFQLRRFGPATWFLIDGIVTLLLGCLIWAQWPFSSVWAIGTLIGISLIFSGVTRLSHRTGARTIPVLGT